MNLFPVPAEFVVGIARISGLAFAEFSGFSIFNNTHNPKAQHKKTMLGFILVPSKRCGISGLQPKIKLETGCIATF